jgi:Protein of unknown function (DUF1566)
VRETWARRAVSTRRWYNTPPCYANNCDWRLPTVKELISLLDYSKYDPAINDDMPEFPSDNNVWYAGCYWSSTSLTAFPAFASWFVDFIFGNVGSADTSQNGDLCKVRVVRGRSNLIQ